MPDKMDESLISAIERLKNNQATSDDFYLIGKAVSAGQIEITPSEETTNIQQVGGTNFGEDNEIRVTGTVIGTQTFNGITGDQVLEIMKSREEKEEEKSRINVPIIVAVIGTIGVIVSGYLGFRGPIVAALIPLRATQTAETKTQLASMLEPGRSPTPNLAPPTLTQTLAPISIQTTPPILTGIPTATFTSTPTFTNTPSPTFAPGADFLASCIHSDIWQPYKLQRPSNIWQPLSPDPDSRGCLNLETWGFFTKDGGLQISHRETVDNTQVGFYKQLDSDAEIEFNLVVDQITTRDNLDSILMFGIIPDIPANPDEGRFLRFFVGGGSMNIMPDEPRVVNRIWRSSEPFGKEYKVKLSLEENKLNMIVDGEPVFNQMFLPNNLFNKRAFWIGYNLWSDSTLDAFISNLKINEN